MQEPSTTTCGGTPGSPERHSWRRPWRLALVALAALVIAGAIIAVTGVGSVRNVGSSNPSQVRGVKSTSGSVGESAPASDAQLDMDVEREVSMAPKTQISPPTIDEGTSVVPDAPRVVRTANLGIEVPKGGFAAAFDRASSIATTNGGFVAGSSTSSYEEADGLSQERNRDVRTGDLTLRVPADRFDSTRQALAGLGTVKSQSIQGEDVSGQLVDYEARLRSLAAQEDALRTLLGKATAVGEVLQVQSQLFSVRQQIEQLTAQRANLDQRATLSSIVVSLFEPGAIFKPEPLPATGLAGSFEQAWNGALAVLGGMVIAIGWSLPLIVVGMAIAGGVRIRRRVRRS